MKRLNFSIIFYPFHQHSYKEVIDIKNIIEALGGNVSLNMANKDLINHLKNENIDLVFNLARNDDNTEKSTSVAALCELLNIKMVGPNVFSSSICNNKDILLQILKYDGISLYNDLNKIKSSNNIEIFLLGNKKYIFFLKRPSNLKLDTSITNKLIEFSKKAYQSIHGSDFCQFRYSFNGKTKLFLKNITPQPLLGNHSDFAKQAKIRGIDYKTFISIIVLNAFTKYNLPIPENYVSINDIFLRKISIFAEFQ